MRKFGPNEPYKDGHIIGIDENGYSHKLWPDGRDELDGYAEERTRIWRGTFTLGECLNLVATGKWHEIQPEEPPEATPSELQSAADHADPRSDVQD